MPPSPKRSFRKTAIAFLAAFAATAGAPAAVQVSGAWARATAPGQDTGAIYLSLRAPAGDTLTGVATPDAGSAMLHQTTRTGGMSGMEDMESLALPPGSVVRLSPGGAHIMLMDLKHKLVAGGRIGLDLTFAKAGVVHLIVPVQPIRAAGPPP